jgi:hypothetical protein
VNEIPNLEPMASYPFAVLPEGVFSCEEAEFHSRFVEAFPESQTRAPICEGFFRLRRKTASLAIAATQWVGGSFVEGKLDPDDVDVVSFVDYDNLNALSTEEQDSVEEVLNGLETTKAIYRAHTFLVPCCPVGHPYYETFERARSSWRNWWGTTREILGPDAIIRPGIRKGFVKLAIGDPALAPTISSDRRHL